MDSWGPNDLHQEATLGLVYQPHVLKEYVVRVMKVSPSGFGQSPHLIVNPTGRGDV